MISATLTTAIQDQITMAKAAQVMGVHVGTGWRYATKGVRGGIKLQTWIIGGKRVTTEAAVEDFLQRLNADSSQASGVGTADDDAGRRGRDAGRALESMGL